MQKHFTILTITIFFLSACAPATALPTQMPTDVPTPTEMPKPVSLITMSEQNDPNTGIAFSVRLEDKNGNGLKDELESAFNEHEGIIMQDFIEKVLTAEKTLKTNQFMVDGKPMKASSIDFYLSGWFWMFIGTKS